MEVSPPYLTPYSPPLLGSPHGVRFTLVGSSGGDPERSLPRIFENAGSRWTSRPAGDGLEELSWTLSASNGHFGAAGLDTVFGFC